VAKQIFRFLFNTYLFVEAQIVNTGGSNLEPDTDVGPVDLWMHSLFSDVSVSLSEKLVTFCPSMTSDARFRPVFKASRPKVLAPLFNKGTADLNRLPKIRPSPCQKAQTSLDEATEHIERHIRLKMAPVHQTLANVRNPNWICLEYHRLRPVWNMAIGSNVLSFHDVQC
jgi:hypothetical protein